MPNKDGTGPLGKGAATGRGLGNCAKNAAPFIAGAITGACLGLTNRRGFGQASNGRGNGQGMGFGKRFQQDKEN